MISHYEENHISGLMGLLHTAPVKQARMPNYTTDMQIYQSLQNVMGEKNIPVIYPNQGDAIFLESRNSGCEALELWL